MTLPVFVVDEAALAAESVELAGNEGRHAVAVKRVRVGERIVLTDGAGQGAECVVMSLGKHSLVADVLVRRSEPLPSPRLVVVQALVKGAAAEQAVDLLTQVGADVIVPWAASRSVATWRGERGAKALLRWRSTAREAAKQSRRLRFPLVEGLQSTPEVISVLRGSATALVLHEGSAAPIDGVHLPDSGDAVLVVGPEGGVSDDELAEFAAVGARPVRLGPSVLRSSAAGAIAAGVLFSRTNRWH
jgi:16S rRNA (uracil1498-N3)-methyltransferase